METKEFPTAYVLSATCGVLVSEGGIGVVYEVLNWMTGEQLFTHQLPRVSEEAAKALHKHNPDVAMAYAEANFVNRDNWQTWAKTWRERYGETMTVPKMTADQHERIDPMSELAEKVHPDDTVVVQS